MDGELACTRLDMSICSNNKVSLRYLLSRSIKSAEICSFGDDSTVVGTSRRLPTCSLAAWTAIYDSLF